MHVPVHAAVDDARPGVVPNVPDGHPMHSAYPEGLYCPAGHMTAVLVVDPAGQ